jgi:serine/threonine protein kinase
MAKKLARCLNPRGGHENLEDALSCRRCDFLVQGATISIYEVISFIGAGSYGHVYKVRESSPLGRTLALKVLRRDQFNDKALASFIQEARRIANLQHPNILPIYNFGQLPDSERPYFVMEYAPQTILDLFRTSDSNRRTAFAEELVPYILQTASALQYIHNTGLIHQDIKPGNLLIGRNGQVLLSDFGTTYYLGMQTHASLGEATGTAAYMPPEQWQGNPRRDSDQYALAICCYELLTGRTPFVSKRLEEMWNAHLKETPAPPQQWNARIPVEVTMVLMRALTKDYHRRYHSTIDFAEAYTIAVRTAQQRYLCHTCGQQNRTGAQRCAFCGAEYDHRTCSYCDHTMRFGQRCCNSCGRLANRPDSLAHSPLIGISIHQGRYIIKRVLAQSEDTMTMTAQAIDTQANNQPVVLKRWECADGPLTQRAKDIAYYERATTPLAQLRHPLVPPLLARFAEGQHYYAVFTYIDSESLTARIQKLLRPLPEREVIHMMNALLNILITLEQQHPPLRHFDISPTNILIEYKRNRIMLTGFQIPAPPTPSNDQPTTGRRTTRKLSLSPYQPLQDKVPDQRICIYALAASMHHALTNVAPPHYTTYPAVRQLNPDISPAFDTIINRALQEDASLRYQTYTALKQDLQALLV